MKQLINLTNDEIHNRFHCKFISLSNASDIVEPNSFMFPVRECLIVHLCVFDKYDTRFISVVDYLMFLKKNHIKIDLKDVDLFMTTTDELEEASNNKRISK